jgi:hypothetical protein
MARHFQAHNRYNNELVYRVRDTSGPRRYWRVIIVLQWTLK